MQYKTILFDLDGTLTDSAPGILNSVRYGCRRIGIPVPDEATLRRFLGPPLIDSFHNLCALNDADTARAVAAFREYFPDKGLFENEVYPGIPALLADLHARGCQLVLATSKPEEYARRIMEHFDLAQYFTAICGATLDETRTDKAEVIAYALDTIGLTDKTGVVMVGDREHDVIGAKKNALPCIGQNRADHQCFPRLKNTIDCHYYLCKPVKAGKYYRRRTKLLHPDLRPEIHALKRADRRPV